MNVESATVTTPDERWDLGLLRAAEGYQRWVLGAFEGALHGDVLEVGAGIGNFTRWIAEESRSVVALEPDPASAAVVRDLALDRVAIDERPVEELAGDGRRFDAITMINVLEHIDDDVSAVRVVAELLGPGGSLCILVPAHPLLMSRLDRGYGHLRRYRKSSVARLLLGAGLAVRTCRYFNALGGIGWLVGVRMTGRRQLTPATVTVTERVIVPAGRRLERAWAPPFGQSIVAIAGRA